MDLSKAGKRILSIVVVITTATVFCSRIDREKTLRRRQLYLDPKSVDVKSVAEKVIDNAPKDLSKLNDHPECPPAVELARGLYKDRKMGSPFQNVVLLTSSNDGYYDILQNWEYLVGQLGLKWSVIAMNERVYKASGDRAVRSVAPALSSKPSTFGKKAFNQISCNKIQSVLDIMEKCDVDVVFSDPDNVFFSDPFRHEFGRLIESNQFDYIYQPNVNILKGTSRSIESYFPFSGVFPKEGNTGFYYMSHKSDAMKQVIMDTMAECANPNPKSYGDDQTLFWNSLHALRQKASKKWKHCTLAEVDTIIGKGGVDQNNTSRDRPTQVCCLDPFYHPTGFDKRHPLFNYKEIVTYHANYCFGKKAKIEKLISVRPDGAGWDYSRVTKKLEGL
eukprot:CAMPEP_0194202468 /NCGR_PEP_ID=MMETSP0156-20130528/2477_1 /TAXON_ID=33649 /ORGANISM="Thalassionema nitzschioides, Strain L26-B" /LENGTH=389 /DNA_ID=CAMNT_0038927965 /DNA_START=30 /DNA_END=1199 /DNA_ORIENTATION=-